MGMKWRIIPLTIPHVDESLASQASNHPDHKQWPPARAIPPHLRLLDAVAHLATPDSPDPMNCGTTGTASAFSEVKPFRAPARDFSSPYKSNSKTVKRQRGKTTQGPRRKKQKQKTVRLNSPSLALLTSDSELDGLVGGMGRLTLADGMIQASLPADDGFNISTAAAPLRPSSLFSLPHSTTPPSDDEAGKGRESAVEAGKGDIAVGDVSGHGPHSRASRSLDDTPLGSVFPAHSTPFRSIRTTPLRGSSIPTATIASAMDPSSASRPCLTAIAVSLVYEVFACPDDEADEVQTWYPIGGGALDLATTGRRLTLGATVEV